MVNWPDAWDACLGELEAQMAQGPFLTFIRPLQAGGDCPGISGGMLTLLAPNTIVAERVDAEYMPEIERAVRNHYGELADGDSVLHQIDLRVGSATEGEPSLRRAEAALPTVRLPAYNPIENASASHPEIGAAMNEDYTLDNFVCGASNEHAFETARGLVQGILGAKNSKKRLYSPLALYGGVGVGKTHLMQAVGHALIKAGITNVAYEHANELTKNIVNAIGNHDIEEVLGRYAALKVLMLDDVQFLVGRGKTQEEVFHLFNKLVSCKAYVIITCDRYPTEVPGIEERLKSRFVGGMSAVIDMPDVETKAAILIQTARVCGRSLDEELAMEVAGRTTLSTTVRDLKGPIQRLCFLDDNEGRPITRAEIEQVARDTMGARKISVDHIQRIVAEHYNISVQALLSRRRTRTLVLPRQIAMALTRRLTPLSYPEIGDHFGGRDHTTVMHGCAKVEALEQESMQTQEDVKILIRMLSSNKVT